jgi:hypothetical protein
MLVVPINKYKVAAQQANVQCPAHILKRIFIFNTLLTRGMHNSWRAILLKNVPTDITLASFAISRQIKKTLNISENKIFSYPDPLQWLSILDNEDLQLFILHLGAFCWASTIKRMILKHQVAELKALIGNDLYNNILNNEMHEISTLYEDLFRANLAKLDRPTQLNSQAPFHQAACELLAVVFMQQPLFFKIRLALRLPYDHAQVLYKPKPLPTLSAENAIKLRQLMFQLLDKVSEQWQKWLV